MTKKEKDLFIKLIKEKKNALVEQKHDLKAAGELTSERGAKIDMELKELSNTLLHLITGV
ncbi:hypothetical protein CUN38_04885 [Enterococcus faecium]|uniref:hypothetical protein n=1 Tax=Enterococcus faecium TaxID=1352 RepID=UPI000CF13DD6|nr:hypothetical protein [Enterococcus faecium]PQC93479.1 hypothetical protein CUN38_04885 [Enterococcus faecium]